MLNLCQNDETIKQWQHDAKLSHQLIMFVMIMVFTFLILFDTSFFEFLYLFTFFELWGRRVGRSDVLEARASNGD